MKKCFWLFFLLCHLAWAKIPLRQAVAEGLRLDAAMQNRALDTDIADLALANAQARRWFNLDAGASYLYKSQEIKMEFPATPVGPGITIPGQTIVAGTHHAYDLKLVLSQPLYSGGMLKQMVQLAKHALAAVRWSEQWQRSDLVSRIETSYFQYRLLRAKRQSLALLLDSLELHQQKLSRLWREELARKSDLLETQIKSGELRLTLQDLDQQVAAEALSFQKFTGNDVREVEDDFREADIAFAEAWARLQTHQPLLQVLDEQLAANQAQEKIVAGAYLPQVAGFAELHFGKPGIDFFHNEWSPYFVGGVSLACNLFSWNRRGREIRMAENQGTKIANQKRDFLQEAEKSLRQLFTWLDTVTAKTAEAEKLVALAQEDAEIKEQLYNEKQLPHADYLAAASDWQRYVSLREELLYQREMVKVAIQALVGNFAEVSCRVDGKF